MMVKKPSWRAVPEINRPTTAARRSAAAAPQVKILPKMPMAAVNWQTAGELLLPETPGKIVCLLV
jgi:hypothetical protein